jgi:hypothetical protein
MSRLTTMYPDHGFYSLALIYLALLIGSFVAPSILSAHFTSPKWIFALAACLYSVYTMSLNFGVAAVLLASLGVGFSGSLLWLKQSLYVTAISQLGGGHIGHLTTLFLGFYSLNMSFGNFLGFQFQNLGLSVTMTIWIMSGVGFLSAALFLLVPTLPQPTGGNRNDETELSEDKVDFLVEKPLFERLQLVGLAFPMKQLIPTLLFNGTFNTLVLGSLPLYLPNVVPGKPSSDLAMLFIIYGMVAAFISPFWGPVFDRRGPLALLKCQFGFTLVAYSLLLAVLINGPSKGAYWTLPVLFVVSGLFGAVDTSTATMVSATISTFVKPHMHQSDLAVSTGFSIHRISFCLAFIFQSLLGALLPKGAVLEAWLPILLINLALFAASTWCYFRLAQQALHSINPVESSKSTAETDCLKSIPVALVGTSAASEMA